MNFIRGFGLPELIIILAVVLLLFGATRLPKLANSMGQAVREFRKAGLSEGQAREASNRRSRSGNKKTGQG